MKYVCVVQQPAVAVDVLAAHTPLSKSQIKDAMNKGAVWLQRGKKQRRLRRAKASLATGDTLHLYHDPNMLRLTVEKPLLLNDIGHYSVWVKPAGLLAQGTKYGDHCSLLRQVELLTSLPKKVFLIHRLDREAIGLMLIAHHKNTAAALSHLFSQNQIEKHYRVQVRGQANAAASFNDDLDQKKACTEYTLLDYDEKLNVSTLDVRIHGGRYHQIRRHFSMHDLPLMGDPRYGQHNKNTSGLALCAYKLAFVCPVSLQYQQFEMTTLPF